MLAIKIAILSTAYAFELFDDFGGIIDEPFSEAEAACRGATCGDMALPPLEDPFEDDCESTISKLRYELNTYSPSDREVLDDLYEQILEAWYSKPFGYDLLDWGMNFNYDTERPFIT